MYGRLFLYTPRSGSKIFARSQCPSEPRWAVETLQNGSHIIHFTAPLYRVPSSTRQHRADVGAILRHVARTADRDTSPRSLLAWDDCGEISFVADEKSVNEIERIVRKFNRGEGLLFAMQHQYEEEIIFGDGGPDTRLFAHPSGAILHVANGYVSTHPAHKSREEVEMEPATFGDLPGSDAQYVTCEVLDALWNGMSAPVPSEAEAEQIVERFAAWMDWCDDTTHAAEMKKMLLDPTGQELQDWANEHFEKHHRISLGFYPEWPAHWVDESKEDEDEIASEPTSEPIAEITAEPTEEEVAAQKKNEEDAAFAETWREHLRGQIGHWMASNLNHPYPRLDTDADVVSAHAEICRRVAAVWAGWSNMWWRSPDIYSRAIDGDGLYPANLPMLPRREEGDSPNDDVWTEWLEQLSPGQLIAFLLYTSEVEGNEADWDIVGFNTNAPDDWKKTINALSHAFPFPFAHMGLEPHPTKKERWVLKSWHDFYLNRRRLILPRWDLLRRHFAALVKMAEHAPE